MKIPSVRLNDHVVGLEKTLRKRDSITASADAPNTIAPLTREQTLLIRVRIFEYFKLFHPFSHNVILVSMNRNTRDAVSIKILFLLRLYDRAVSGQRNPVVGLRTAAEEV